MTPALSATAFLHFATIFLAQRFLTRDVGRVANMGTRENLEAQLSPLTLRLRRATANFVENIAVVVVLRGRASTHTPCWPGFLSPPASSTSQPMPSTGAPGARPSGAQALSQPSP